MFNERDLIELVKNHELLYKRDHSDYSNQVLRENIWRDIAKNLGANGSNSPHLDFLKTAILTNVLDLSYYGYQLVLPARENRRSEAIVCKEKWSRIRENFRKAMLLRKLKTSTGNKYHRPPKHYNHLVFLLPYLRDDSSQSFDVQEAGDANDDDGSDSSQSNPTFGKIKRSYSTAELNQEASEEDNQEQERTEEVIVYESQPNPSGSEQILTEFFVNMSKTVARFPLKQQLEIKEKLFLMVHDVEVELAENKRAHLF